MVVVCAVAAVQLTAVLRLVLRARRARAPLPEPAPSVAVVVAYKGGGREVEAAVASLLAQDYSGPLEWRFVVESERDEAVAVLRAAAAREPRARVIVSGETPERSSAKALRLLAGAGRGC